MFDNINPAVLFWILAFAINLPVQLLLCFKAKKKIFRSLPAIIHAVSIIIFFFVGSAVGGPAVLGYIFLCILSGVSLAACAAGWIIWACRNKRNS